MEADRPDGQGKRWACPRTLDRTRPPCRTSSTEGATIRFRSAFLLCGNRDEAEDLVQSTLLKVILAWRRLERIDSVEAYARRTLVNVFIGSRRRMWRREQPYGDVPEHAAPAPDVDAALAVQAALARLPIKQRTVLVLRFWEDLSAEATADLLGMRPGTVRSHSSRGIAALRRSCRAGSASCRGRKHEPRRHARRGARQGTAERRGVRRPAPAGESDGQLISRARRTRRNRRARGAALSLTAVAAVVCAVTVTRSDIGTDATPPGNVFATPTRSAAAPAAATPTDRVRALLPPGVGVLTKVSTPMEHVGSTTRPEPRSALNGRYTVRKSGTAGYLEVDILDPAQDGMPDPSASLLRGTDMCFAQPAGSFRKSNYGCTKQNLADGSQLKTWVTPPRRGPASPTRRNSSCPTAARPASSPAAATSRTAPSCRRRR